MTSKGGKPGGGDAMARVGKIKGEEKKESPQWKVTLLEVK